MKRRFKVLLYEEIRREYEQGVGSIRGVARKLGVHRRDVRAAIANAIPAPRKRPKRSCPAIDPVRDFIDAILRADQTVPRKHRHTARRIRDRILEEKGHVLAESTLRRYVRLRKEQLGFMARETCIPQTYAPGQEAQVDWYEAWAELDGEMTAIQVFTMRAMYSGAAFHKAYLRATQQALLEAHEEAFAFFGGVFRTNRYDNLKAAVKKILRGRQREETERFIAFRSHWGFAAEFCNVESGNEKGGVEGEVGYFRRNNLTPILKARDLADLNAQLRERCRKAEARMIGGRKESVGALLLGEREHLLSLALEPFDLAERSNPRVDGLGRVKVRTNWYSVPIATGRRVEAKLHADRLEILFEGRVVARHERCYGRGEEILNLEHYLDVLARKPGALADSTPPSTFSLTAPANNTLTGSAAITFRWSNSIDATSPPVTYRLQIDTSAAFTAPAIDTFWISETRATVTLPRSDTWYWRVFARDFALNPNLRQSSETWIVTVDSEPPSSPILAAFQGATKVTPLRLLWTAPSDSISGVARILFRLDNAQPFAEPYTESTGLAPTETTRWTTVLPAGTYYWTLTAYDTLGNAAASSPAIDSFVVVADTTAPVAPPVEAPPLTNDSSSSCTVSIYIVDDAAVETVFVNLTVLGGSESTAAVPNSPPPSTDSLWIVTLPVDSTVSEGTYNLVVTFIDATGNTGTTTITVTVTDNSPSLAEVVESPLISIRAGGDFLSIISTYGDSYARIEYQYREAGVGAWKTCTPAAGSANPDMTPPFWGFHWDISNQAEFRDGRTYEIRARATTTEGVTDPSPSHLRIIIDRTDSTHYERRNASGLIEAHHRIPPDTITQLSIVDPIPGLNATTLIIPAGAVTETVWVRVTLMDTSPAGIALPTGFVSDSTGIFRRFEVAGKSGRTRFLKPLTITLPYNDAEGRQAWLKPGASTVDGGRNTVTATTGHFTIFAVLAPAEAAANLTNVIIYPNPWIPNDGNSRTGIPYDGTPNSGIIFENLPQQITIEIYSLAGKLVSRMQKNDAFGRYNWDGQSDDNLDVASGVYLVVIKTESGERVVKKVMIIR